MQTVQQAAKHAHGLGQRTKPIADTIRIADRPLRRGPGAAFLFLGEYRIPPPGLPGGENEASLASALFNVQHVLNNPVKGIDPSGHKPLCEEDFEEGCEDPDFPPLPPLEEINAESSESPESVKPEWRESTIAAYDFIRNWLYENYGWYYLSKAKTIPDGVLMAIIISGEFNMFSEGELVFLEALEALGNQYYDEDFIGNSHCSENGCSVAQQIAWLYGMEFVRNEERRTSALENFESQIGNAILAMNDFHVGRDESWFWGNVDEEHLKNYSITAMKKTDSYDGRPYFIVYR